MGDDRIASFAGQPPAVEGLGSWEIECAAARGAVVIKVTDYHAGPLELSADQLRSILRRLEPDTARAPASPQPSPPPSPPVAAAAPAPPGSPQSPLFTVSRKDKRLRIEIPEGWAGTLTLTRRELYRYGKRMGKRGGRASA